MQKPLIPLEVPFRVFVALTFAGTITFHILGLGIHTAIGHQKNALVTKIETLAEVKSQLLGVEAGLSVLEDRLRVSEEKAKEPGGREGPVPPLPQVRVMTLLLQNLPEAGAREGIHLASQWQGIAEGFNRCLGGGVGRVEGCLRKVSGLLPDFGRALARTREEVIRHLSHVEKWQSRLERWDTILYWLTTVLGLLFMALGWRNVVLQVGNPIKDVAQYLEGVQEKEFSGGSRLPALFSIRELRILKENMRNVHHDSLTGLLTRQALALVLRQEMTLAAGRGTPLAVICLDMDHLSRVNDRFGEETGDRLLRQAGKTLAANLRSGESCGRWNGDRFLLVSPSLSGEMARARLGEIREILAFPLPPDSEGERRMSVSGGVALFREGLSLESLVREAKESLSRGMKEKERSVDPADEAPGTGEAVSRG